MPARGMARWICNPLNPNPTRLWGLPTPAPARPCLSVASESGEPCAFAFGICDNDGDEDEEGEEETALELCVDDDGEGAPLLVEVEELDEESVRAWRGDTIPISLAGLDTAAASPSFCCCCFCCWCWWF